MAPTNTTNGIVWIISFHTVAKQNACHWAHAGRVCSVHNRWCRRPDWRPNNTGYFPSVGKPRAVSTKKLLPGSSKSHAAKVSAWIGFYWPRMGSSLSSRSAHPPKYSALTTSRRKNKKIIPSSPPSLRQTRMVSPCMTAGYMG